MEQRLAQLTQRVQQQEALLAGILEGMKDVGSPSASTVGDNNKATEVETTSSLSSLLRSVVKVYCNDSVPNFLIPWQRKLQTSVTGSGFVVDRKRRLILTNAHVVIGAPFVELRKHGGAAKYTGFIVYVGAECDLALVQIPDDEFWQSEVTLPELTFDKTPNSKATPATNEAASGLEALQQLEPFGGLPALQEKVQVAGYPVGGDQISITSGVVSRVDQSMYGGIDVRMLTIQIDAAINSGNSGGPALCRNRVVGVAFQALMQGDNIGYIIPNPIISMFARTFYRDVAQRLLSNGTFAPKEGDAVSMQKAYHPGYCALGVRTMDASNVHLRKSVGLPPGSDGSLVIKPLPLSSADGVLLEGDVIMKVNGYAVATDLTIEFRPDERVLFSHLMNTLLQGETASITIWRDKKELTVEVAAKLMPRLLPNHLFNNVYQEKPRYEIFGGFVLTTLTFPLLLEWGQNEWFNNSPRNLSHILLNEFRTAEREDVIAIVQVLPHVVNKGYESAVYNYRVVESINGVAIRSFEQLRTLLRELKDEETARFSVSGPSFSSCPVVLPVKEARSADQHLRALYNIPEGN